MGVRYVTGDLFLSRAQTLAHGVNCAGRMGRGVAVEFRRRFPGMYEEYRRRCRSGALRPGGVYLESGTTPWVLNLATQADLGGAEIGSVESCLHWVAREHATQGITSLAMPRIAAGLGGLTWESVRPLIDEVLGPLDLPVLVFESFVPGATPTE